MDLNKSLRLAIDTGKVSVGANESTKAIISGSARLVILSSNCPDELWLKLKMVKPQFIHSTEITLFWVQLVESLSQFLS